MSDIEENGELSIHIPQYNLLQIMKSGFDLDGQVELTCRTCGRITKHRHVSNKNKFLHSWITCLDCRLGNTCTVSGAVALVHLHCPPKTNKITIGYTSGIVMMVINSDEINNRKVKIDPEHINEYLLNLMVIF